MMQNAYLGFRNGMEAASFPERVILRKSEETDQPEASTHVVARLLLEVKKACVQPCDLDLWNGRSDLGNASSNAEVLTRVPTHLGSVLMF